MLHSTSQDIIVNATESFWDQHGKVKLSYSAHIKTRELNRAVLGCCLKMLSFVLCKKGWTEIAKTWDECAPSCTFYQEAAAPWTFPKDPSWMQLNWLPGARPCPHARWKTSTFNCMYVVRNTNPRKSTMLISPYVLPLKKEKLSYYLITPL